MPSTTEIPGQGTLFEFGVGTPVEDWTPEVACGKPRGLGRECLELEPTVTKGGRKPRNHTAQGQCLRVPGTLVGACEGRLERASSLESAACTWNPNQD